MDSEQELKEIFKKIERRTQSIRQVQPSWPCQKGCSLCCRRLAFPLALREAEWVYLSEGMALLSETIQAEVEEKIEALEFWSKEEQPHIVCPLLDEATGACRVYEHRPAACRMYGYYVARNNNQWCQEIEDRYKSNQMADVILGNYATTTQRLQQISETEQSIVAWHKRDKKS